LNCATRTVQLSARNIIFFTTNSPSQYKINQLVTEPV